MSLSITILHRLDNRIRINFSDPIRNFEKLKFLVMEHEGIETFDYTPVTRGLLVQFDNDKVNLQEILIRTAVAYSLENDLGPVKISQKGKKDFITAKGAFAGISIITAFILSYLSKNVALISAMKWISAGTTTAAVIEHAAFDYRIKGSVDPEVLSLGLLANSIINNKKILLPSALTWVSTFGRHFSKNENEGILLEVSKRKEENNKAFYHINVSKLKNKGNLADLLNQFAESFLSSEAGFKNTIFEGAQEMVKSHDNFIEGIGEKVNGMVLNFNQ